MSEILGLIVLAFFTSPLWYPLFTLDRLEREVRESRRRGGRL